MKATVLLDPSLVLRMKKSTYCAEYITRVSFSKTADKDGANVRAFYYDGNVEPGLEIKKKSLGCLLATNWRNIVARCKF